MKHQDLLPFERNRYYEGKLLTSADFQTEQNYMNNKRRFLNTMLFGEGIVCGLGIYNMNDLSVMIESGAAIDYQGREIVIEHAIVKKLSAMEGYDTLKTNRASICLRYMEEEIHPVYAIQKHAQGEEYENNRITETYQIFMKDSVHLEQEMDLDSEFFQKAALYEDEDYLVTIQIPSCVSCGTHVKVALIVYKKTAMKSGFSLETSMQVPAFLTDCQTHELFISTGTLHLQEGEMMEQEYWLKASSQETAQAELLLEADSIRVIKKGNRQKVDSQIVLTTAIAAISPRELVTREIGKNSLEMRQMAKKRDYIRLADCFLTPIGEGHIIDYIQEDGIKKYIAVPAQEELRSRYHEYFKDIEECRESEEIPLNYQEAGDSQEEKIPMMASGVCEIVVGADAKKGDVRYTGEIMHGLGAGNVYVEVGLEYVQSKTILERSLRQTIYGDPELFPDSQAPASIGKAAVKVLHEKGTFIVGVQLLKEPKSLLIPMRWTAIRLTREDIVREEAAGREGMIYVERSTFAVRPGESNCLQIRFKDMTPCALSYDLTESNSGMITREGIYTAPMKEGVYEIRIYCTDMPLISTYAYAIVKKKE